MAHRIQHAFSFAVLFLLSCVPQYASANWAWATIGSVDGGSCGFTTYPDRNIKKFGFSQAIYYSGGTCGGCYLVWCVNSKNCIKGASVVAMATNECMAKNTSSVCVVPKPALNLQPEAWDTIVSSRAGGVVQVYYKPVKCTMLQGGVQFNATVGAPYYTSVLIQNVAGYGRLAKVEVAIVGRGYRPMTRAWGNNFALSRFTLVGHPLSFRLTSVPAPPAFPKGQVIVASNVFPQQWSAGNFYSSNVNFRNW